MRTIGQVEVYEFLKNQRLSGNDSYFSPTEIKKIFKDLGYSSGVISGVLGDLIKLEIHGYLEIKMSGDFRDWIRLFRLKKEYMTLK